MTWEQAIAGWLTWLAAGGARKETRSLRRYQLLRVAADLGGRPDRLTAAAVAEWMVGHEWAPETRRSQIAALRSFYMWAIAEGVASADPTARLPRVQPPPGQPRPAPEGALSRARSSGDERQRLMIDLAALHGLRCGEIARIHAKDLSESSDGTSLLVHGKGGKQRTIPLLPETAAAIVERAGGGWLFDNHRGSHLTPGHVGVLIRRTLPPGVTPHMLRHRFATVVYRRTLDIRNLQLLLGHASVATTQRYAAPDADQLRRVLASAAA